MYQYIIIVTHIPECVNNWEALKELALVVVAFAIGGYIANWAIFKWYEIPTKVDAVNNALWQLLNR